MEPPWNTIKCKENWVQFGFNPYVITLGQGQTLDQSKNQFDQNV